jgi:hypothetical protein
MSKNKITSMPPAIQLRVYLGWFRKVPTKNKLKKILALTTEGLAKAINVYIHTVISTIASSSNRQNILRGK